MFTMRSSTAAGDNDDCFHHTFNYLWKKTLQISTRELTNSLTLRWTQAWTSISIIEILQWFPGNWESYNHYYCQLFLDVGLCFVLFNPFRFKNIITYVVKLLSKISKLANNLLSFYKEFNYDKLILSLRLNTSLLCFRCYQILGSAGRSWRNNIRQPGNVFWGVKTTKLILSCMIIFHFINWIPYKISL